MTARHWRCPKCGHEEVTPLPALAVLCPKDYVGHRNVAMRPLDVTADQQQRMEVDA